MTLSLFCRTLRRAMFATAILLISQSAMRADTVSDNLSSPTASTEIVADDTWITASFTTDANSYALSEVTLLLSNPIRGMAELDLYSGTAQPDSLLSTLTPPASYSTSLAKTTFMGERLLLAANSTYWLVLKASSGDFEWGWTDDSSGSGSGFTHTWGASDNAGATWFIAHSDPMQFRVTASPAAPVPEPTTAVLFTLTIGAVLIWSLGARRYIAGTIGSSVMPHGLLFVVLFAVPIFSASGQSLDCTMVPPLPSPALSDLAGWTNPGRYNTFQLADIDGDGTDEFLARDSSGVRVWKLINGSWVEKNPTGLFSDKAVDENGIPFNASQPEYYRTILFEDVDGDGQAEMVGRSPSGVAAFHYDKTTDRWTQISHDSSLPFTDAAHWNEPQYYRTFRLADIDGDRQAEFIARGANGLAVYHYNKTTREWDQEASFGPLSDSDGYNEAPYYDTIRTGDFNGDGRAELVVRSHLGLIVYSWNQTDHSWRNISNDGPLNDENGWNQQPLYSTIQTANLIDSQNHHFLALTAHEGDGMLVYRFQGSGWTQLGSAGPFGDPSWTNQPYYYPSIKFADLDGDSVDELIGRPSDGLEVWHWSASNSNWAQVVTQGPWKDSGGWAQLSQYSTIRAAKGVGILGRSFLGVETLGLSGNQLVSVRPPLVPFPPFTGNQASVYSYMGQQLFLGCTGSACDIRSAYTDPQQNWTEAAITLRSLTRPSRFSSSDWNSVLTVLTGDPTSIPRKIGEFELVSAINTWFQKNNQLFTQEAIIQKVSADQVSSTIALPDAQKNQPSGFGVFLAVLKIAGSFASLGGPELSAAVNFATNTLALASVFEAGNSSSNNLQLAESEIDGRIAAVLITATEVNSCQQQRTMSDYGLFQDTGYKLASNQWTWGDTTTSAIVNAATFAYITSLYQGLTPIAWQWLAPYLFCNPMSGLCNYSDVAPDGYPKQYIHSRDNAWIALATNDVLAAAPTTALNTVFGTPDLENPTTSGLGASLEDVYSGNNGWSIPQNFSHLESNGNPKETIQIRRHINRLFHLVESLPNSRKDVALVRDVTLIAHGLENQTNLIPSVRTSLAQELSGLAAYINYGVTGLTAREKELLGAQIYAAINILQPQLPQP